MKKLLGISLVAIMSVSAANAEIASKAYVDQQDDAITDTIGALSGLTQGITNTSVVAAINSVAEAAGGDVSAVVDRLDVLEGDDQTSGSVAKSIADALTAYTETGQDTAYATAAQGAKADTALQPADVTASGSNGVTASASDGAITVTGVAATTSAAGVVQLADAAAVTAGTAGRVVDAAQLKSVADTASGALDNYYTETEADAKFQTLDNLATSSTWSTDKSSDTKYASAKAVDAAITAAGGQTAQQVSDAIDTKVGTLDDTSGAAQAGKWVTAVTQTDGKITATMADPLAAFTKLGQNAGDGVYALTATATDGNITGYKWELIQRASGN